MNDITDIAARARGDRMRERCKRVLRLAREVTGERDRLKCEEVQRTIERDRAERAYSSTAVELKNARWRLKAIYGALRFIGDDGPDLDAYVDGHCDADAPRRIADLISNCDALRFELKEVKADRDRLAGDVGRCSACPDGRARESVRTAAAYNEAPSPYMPVASQRG